jgi:uncharacterized protein (TIGR02246 family)
MRRLALSLVLLLLAAAPAMAQSKTAIQKLDDQWAAAFNKGDPAAVVAMYTADAYVLPAGAPMVHTPGDIQDFWSKAMGTLGDVKCTALDVKPLGRSAAREVGTCTFTTKGDKPEAGALKYAVVWEKDKTDGRWKLLQDIWNMDK